MAGYIGSKAAVVSSGYPTGAERKNTFTITGTTTVLAGLSYTPNFTHVYHSGVRLVAGTDYTATDGTTITLTVAAENGDEIVVISYATFQVADAYTKAETYTKSEADAGFVSDPNGAVTVDGSGNVLFGCTSSPSASVVGSGFIQTAYDNELRLSTSLYGGNNLIQFINPNGIVGNVSTSGTSTSFATSSDYRLKENITPVQGAADIVKAMQPVTYTFKADSADWHDGFLAHELQELHPRAVTGSKDAMQDEEYEVTPAVLDEDGVVVSEAVMGTRSVPDYQGVDYSKLTPILTAALKEALTKIEVLEAQNAIFETRLTALEAT